MHKIDFMTKDRILVNCARILYQDVINALMGINVILVIKTRIEKYSQIVMENAIAKVNILKTITNNVFYVQ